MVVRVESPQRQAPLLPASFSRLFIAALRAPFVFCEGSLLPQLRPRSFSFFLIAAAIPFLSFRTGGGGVGGQGWRWQCYAPAGEAPVQPSGEPGGAQAAEVTAKPALTPHAGLEVLPLFRVALPVTSMLLQKLPPTLPLRVTGKITPSRYGFRRLCGRRISEEESNPERSCRNACLTWFCKLEVIGEPLCGSCLPLYTLAVGGARITQHFGEYQSSELPPPRSFAVASPAIH
jgi:hypothetical protein